jgi:hypothetical protein
MSLPLDVIWTTRAARQLAQLTAAEQCSAQQTIDALRHNPDVGGYEGTRIWPNGGQQIVYAVRGLLVKIRYVYQGIWNRRLAIKIEDVRPNDIPGGSDLD